MTDVKNIHDTEIQQGKSKNDSIWRFLDLSRDKIGIRVEELPPGGHSSIHHFHSLEEEHIIILEGASTQILGEDNIPLKKGGSCLF